MDNYMGYVYQHKEGLQKNAKGVTVEISELDSNNNFYVIGNATTDENGVFKFLWQPEISGTFRIYAKFLGTNGYFPSSAETVLAVEPAPSPSVAPTASASVQPTITPPPTATPTQTASPIQPTPLPPTGGLSTEAYVAIAAVVIIAIVAAIALILRRRQ
jgi:cell division septation protein DedD